MDIRKTLEEAKRKVAEGGKAIDQKIEKGLCRSHLLLGDALLMQECACALKARTCLRTVMAALSVLLSVYAILYMGRFIKVNCCGWSEDIKASQLPKEVVSCVELYDDPPESVGVYVLHRDLDGDGMAELIVDSGTNARGAANWWYTIWKKLPSGIYHEIGFFCSDSYLFVPGLGIRGLPGILCNHGKIEWVPWRGGQYSCRGPI